MVLEKKPCVLTLTLYLACHFMFALLDIKVFSGVMLKLENYNLLHNDLTISEMLKTFISSS